MISWTRRLAVGTCLALIAGCSDDVVAMNDCYAELDQLPIVETVTIDVEELVKDIVDKRGAEPYWPDIQQIETACEPPAVLPDQSDHFTSTPTTGRIAKPVRHVRLDGRSGVVFAYRSRGVEETTTGLAAAFVEYQPDGTPRRIYKASELLGDEGWGRLTTSALTATSIERCDQELEYFIYSAEGDVVEELEMPTRTPRFCERIVLMNTNG